MLKKIALLFVVSSLLELAFFGVYYYAASGPLHNAFASHEKELRENTLPPVESIDLQRGDWVKVARFESAFSEISFATSILFSLFVSWLLIFGGISGAISAVARKAYKNVHAERIYYLIVLTCLSTLIAIPAYISGYYIEMLRGTSNVTPFMAFEDFILNLFLDLLFIVATFIPFYWIMDKFRRSWWAIGAAFLILFSIFTGYIAPIAIDPLFAESHPLEEGLLKERVLTLAHRAGVSVNRVYVEAASIRTLESNAYVAGLWGTKRVIIDDTLLTYYTDSEILAVLAHELGHYAMYHIWKDIAYYALQTFIFFGLLALILSFVLKHWGKRIGSTNINDIALYPLIGVILSAMSLVASPIDSAFSRNFERQADEFGIELTDDPKPAITSFKKMAYQSFVDPDPPAVLQSWFGTHPTMKERIEFLERRDTATIAP